MPCFLGLSLLAAIQIDVQAADSTRIDSLEKLIIRASDTTRLHLMIELGRLKVNDGMELEEVAHILVQSSEELGYKRGSGWGHLFHGRWQGAQGNHQSALEAYTIALQRGEQVQAPSLQVSALMASANTHLILREHERATSAYLDAIQRARTHHLFRSEAMALRGMAYVYLYLEEYDKAIEQLEQVMLMPFIRSDSEIRSNVLNVLGIAHYEQKSFNIALDYFERALKAHRVTGIDAETGSSVYLLNIANVHAQYGDLDSALHYFIWAESVESNMPGKIVATGNIAYTYFVKKSYPEAARYYQKALDYAEEQRLFEEVADFSNGLSQTYEAMGHWKEALAYAHQTTEAKDSLLQRMRKSTSAKADEAINQLAQQKQIQELEEKLDGRERQVDSMSFYTTLLVVALLLTLALVGVIIIMTRKVTKIEANKSKKGSVTSEEPVAEQLQPPPVHTLPSSSGNKTTLINVDDIQYFEADGRYVFAYKASGEKYLIDLTLRALEAKLETKFIRIHRSVLVSRNAIQSVHRKSHSWFITLKDNADPSLPVGGTYLDKIKQLIEMD